MLSHTYHDPISCLHPIFEFAKKIFIFGGGKIYKLALSFCSQIELTLVDVSLKKGVTFPCIDKKNWKKKLIQKVEGNESYPPHSFWVYNRK